MAVPAQSIMSWGRSRGRGLTVTVVRSCRSGWGGVLRSCLLEEKTSAKGGTPYTGVDLAQESDSYLESLDPC